MISDPEKLQSGKHSSAAESNAGTRTQAMIGGERWDDAAKSRSLSTLDVFEHINCACSLNVSQLILAAKAEHTNARGVDDGDYAPRAPADCFNSGQR